MQIEGDPARLTSSRRNGFLLGLGANVGASVISWILSLAGVSGSAWYVAMFKPATFTPMLALVGAALPLFDKNVAG